MSHTVEESAAIVDNDPVNVPDDDPENVPDDDPENVPDDYEQVVDLTKIVTNTDGNLLIDLTTGQEDSNDECMAPVEENDVIIAVNDIENMCAEEINLLHDLDAADENIPDRIYWESILSSLETLFK